MIQLIARHLSLAQGFSHQRCRLEFRTVPGDAAARRLTMRLPSVVLPGLVAGFLIAAHGLHANDTLEETEVLDGGSSLVSDNERYSFVNVFDLAGGCSGSTSWQLRLVDHLNGDQEVWNSRSDGSWSGGQWA
jgi:hypothetical protein